MKVFFDNMLDMYTVQHDDAFDFLVFFHWPSTQKFVLFI